MISLCAAPWPGRSALFTDRVRFLLPEAPRGALAGQRMQIYRSFWAPGNPDCDKCAAPWPGRSALSFQASGCLCAAHLGRTGGSQHEMRMLGKAAEIVACTHREIRESFHKLQILQQCKINHDSIDNVHAATSYCFCVISLGRQINACFGSLGPEQGALKGWRAHCLPRRGSMPAKGKALLLVRSGSWQSHEHSCQGGAGPIDCWSII